VEHLGGSQIFLLQLAGSALEERAQHGGTKTLAANVPYEDQGGPVCARKELIEVTAHLTGGPICSVARKMSDSRQFNRYKLALRAAGRLHLRA
jgi:hypothetical protein